MPGPRALFRAPSLPSLVQAPWGKPEVPGSRRFLAPGQRGRSMLLLALPAAWLLGTGALAALLVADILVYLVDSLVPAHTAERRVVGINRDRAAFVSAGGGPPPFSRYKRLSLPCLGKQPGCCTHAAGRLGGHSGGPRPSTPLGTEVALGWQAGVAPCRALP